MKNTNRAFTLVELLIVVAVLAILAAAIYPVFASARERGRQTACLNNLKQISLVLQQYAQDNDGKYPGPTYFYGSEEYVTKGRSRGLPSRLRDRRILWCPTGIQPRPGTASVATDNSSLLFTNYAYNTELIDDMTGRGNIGREEASAPADSLILVFDGSYEPGQGKITNVSGCPAQVAAPYYPILHNKGGNYLFADGHATWMLPETAVSIQCKTANAMMLPSK